MYLIIKKYFSKIVLALLVFSFVFANEQTFTQRNKPNLRPSNCCRALSFSLEDLPAPPLMTGIGSSKLEITTKSQKAQDYFNQGLNLLHCFWEFEAYRAFKEASRLDNKCAMAYWGMATALPESQTYQNKKEELLKKANGLSKDISEHEQLYIEAYQKLATLSGSEATEAFNEKMEILIDRYPQDNDAKLFYAWSITSGYKLNGQPKEDTLFAQQLVENVLLKDPNSAAANHYWIHVMESGHPERALEAANKLPKLAPNSGHIVHMPGHIYYQLGEYEKARQAFLASREVDKAYMEEQQIPPIDTWNYIHNLDYLIANCLEDGRYKEGLAYAKESQEILLSDKQIKALHAGASRILYISKTASAKLCIRYGKWIEAIKSLEQLIKQPQISIYAEKYYKGLLAYVEGRQELESNNLVQANVRLTELDSILWQLSKQMDKPNGAPEERFSEAMEILEIMALELRGLVLSYKNQHIQAIELLKTASEKEQELGYSEPPQYVRPVWESLAQVYLRADKWQQAKEAYEAELKARPNNGHALYGIAQVLAAIGKKKEATLAYQRFLQAWQNADPDLSQINKAKIWLQNVS